MGLQLQSETRPPSQGSTPATVPGRAAPQWALIGLFLAVLALVPALQLILEARRGDSPKALEVFSQKPTAAHLRAYERSLETASFPANYFRPWIHFAQFAWGRDGGEKALLGRDGWCFYKPGVDVLVSGRATSAHGTNDPVRAIVDFRDQLAARGIRLMVMVAPNKESVYPDMLTSRAAHLRQIRGPATAGLLGRLQAAQVEVLDLFALFAHARTEANSGSPPLYLAQDSHWSPAGVRLAARSAAERLHKSGWVQTGSVPYQEKMVPVKRIGDILRMLQVPEIERRTVPETVSAVQILDEQGRPYRDDPKAEVLVLGDSFLRIYEQDEPGSAGFIAHLAKELKQPLASLVSDGGASTLVRQELYRRPGLLSGKKVVIWEFVERDILLGAEGWQLIPLPERKE